MDEHELKKILDEKPSLKLLGKVKLKKELKSLVLKGRQLTIIMINKR